jgi:hypothetical protein
VPVRVPVQDRHSQLEAARAGQPPTSKRKLAELELRNTAHREPRRGCIVSFNINYTRAYHSDLSYMYE